MDSARGPRPDIESVRTFLNRLDRAAVSRGGPDFRRWERYPYRVKALHVDVLDQDDHPVASHFATGRNIARGGISFINDRLIYPGSACRVRLVGPHNHEQATRGHVVHCRYIVGSGTLYEIGTCFDRLVDLSLFAPRSRFVHVLLVDADPAVYSLLRGFCASLNVEFTAGITLPAEVIPAALEQNPDLVLIDLEDPAIDAFTVATQLRNTGFVNPIVGLAVEFAERLYARSVTAGFTGYLRKPIARQAARSLITSLMDKPLVSALAHDPALAPLINDFVDGLPRRVKWMAAALKREDLGDLDRIVHGIRGEAGSYGFEPITEAAAELQLLIAGRAPLLRVRHSLDHLIHLCLTARPATCGDVITGPRT